MIDATQFEDRASRSRGTHEGETSQALCDRLSRTRDSSQRQLPTDHDHAVSTREYQTDQSSLNLPPLPLALSLKNKNHPTAVQWLTGSLHIRAFSWKTLVLIRSRSAMSLPPVAWRYALPGAEGSTKRVGIFKAKHVGCFIQLQHRVG